MPDFARRADELIDALERLRGAELMGLAEYAVDRLHQVLESCDDSDGYMSDLLGRLVKLHVRACGEARPEPAAFARRLFERQMGDDWGTWPGVEAYSAVLGEAGLAAYARLARAAWDQLPALRPGDADQDRWSSRFRIKDIMQRLAGLTGDPEALVEIERKDLSSAYAFLRVAEIYRDAGRHDAALDWAERGLAAFPQAPDWRIQDFLAEEYFRRERPDEAMALAWAQFVGRGGGSAEGYRKFMERARRAADAGAWRKRALDALREAAVRHHQQCRPLYGRRPERPDFTQLVRALLGEKDLDAALAEAKAGLCHPDTLVDLARALAAGRAEEAIALYRRAVEPIVERKNNQAYAEAATVLRAARELYRELGRAREFGDWLAEVRLAHKPKRNFMKLLDAL
jgi:tetratricopeptide (TPR) repeat protein